MTWASEGEVYAAIFLIFWETSDIDLVYKPCSAAVAMDTQRPDGPHLHKALPHRRDQRGYSAQSAGPETPVPHCLPPRRIYTLPLNPYNGYERSRVPPIDC
jgi:hypothetical protein